MAIRWVLGSRMSEKGRGREERGGAGNTKCKKREVVGQKKKTVVKPRAVKCSLKVYYVECTL